MDNLTHSLVGAALARTGLDRATPLATATLVVAANVPDIDVLAHARGEWFALAFRRGVTHGLPALVLLPLVVAGAIAAWDRLVRRRRAPELAPTRLGPLVALSYLGALTHPTLDWMNTYGMRWWLPLDGRWSYGDNLFIIDPWLWLLLGAAAALVATRTRPGHAGWITLAFLTSLVVVGTPFVGPVAKSVWLIGIALIALVRVRGRPATARGAVRLARALTTGAAVYVLAMMGISSAAATDVHRAATAAGLSDVDAVVVQPLPANPLAAEVIVQTPDRYVRGSHRWMRTPRVALGELPDLMRAPAGRAAQAAIAQASRHPDVARYLTWSRLPYWSVEREDAGAVRVRVGDARYDGRAGGLAGLSVRVARVADE